MTTDTIAAIATPPGAGGVGIIRISGPKALDAAGMFFCANSGRPLKDSEPRTMHAGAWIDPGTREMMDECLCVWFRAPASYTGEDVVEAHLHGGFFHLNEALRKLLRQGCRQALAGEFTQRAFVNGKLDLTQAEAVQDLVSTGSDLGEKTAAEQLRGALLERAEALRKKVTGLCAQVEAAVDFPDEEAQVPGAKKKREEARGIRGELEAWLKTAAEGKRARLGARVVLAGRTNAGKSSLMNALLGEERAIVSEARGTTRDFLEEQVMIGAYPVVLVDTAGLGRPEDPVEKQGVDRTRKQMEKADLCLKVLDASTALDEEDIALLRQEGAESLVVLNKADLPAAVKAEELRTGAPICLVSAKSRQGLPGLKEMILEILEKKNTSAKTGSAMLTRTRHEEAVRRAVESMKHVEMTMDEKPGEPELLSGDLRDVLDALGDLVGATTRNDVVEEIFRRFCIGK